mgnify:CR=1 FL=1
MGYPPNRKPRRPSTQQYSKHENLKRLVQKLWSIDNMLITDGWAIIARTPWRLGDREPQPFSANMLIRFLALGSAMTQARSPAFAATRSANTRARYAHSDVQCADT